MKKIIQDLPLLSGNLAYSTSFVLSTEGWDTGVFHNVFAVASSAAKTFVAAGVDIVNNQVTSTAHGFATGRKFALTGAGLPAPLTATNYFAIAVDANTLKFAATLADAIATTPVPIDLTTVGTGTSTMTPAALSACSIKLQESNTNVAADFIDIASMTSTITVTGTSIWKPNTDAQFIKLVFTITDGQIAFNSQLVAKGS
jgi:hypothetical protein